MVVLLIILGFVALNVVLGVVSALDLRPQLRPPEWSVGRLITPRH
jgi:hypothetical protein